MLSLSPLAVEQLSDSPEFPGFCGSSDSLFFRHLNRRLITAARSRLTTADRMSTTTTRMTMKLVTPKTGTVSTDSDVGLGRMVSSSLVLGLEGTELGVAFRGASPLARLLLVVVLLPSGALVPSPDVSFCG